MQGNLLGYVTKIFLYPKASKNGGIRVLFPDPVLTFINMTSLFSILSFNSIISCKIGKFMEKAFIIISHSLIVSKIVSIS